MEITKQFFMKIPASERRYAAPKDSSALARGRMNEICFVRFMQKRVGLFCAALDTNGLYADTKWKVDVCVMRADDIEALYQVKSSRWEAEQAASDLRGILHTYHGIAHRVVVVYPDDNGTWVFLK